MPELDISRSVDISAPVAKVWAALTVLETGFEALSESQAAHDGNAEGWLRELDQLAEYLEVP